PPTPAPATHCRTSDRTATCRGTYSRSATPATASPVHTSRAASCFGITSTSSTRRTSRSDSRAMAVDLLVFGPHPDDLEIGLGGTIARHVAQGLQVGLCDLSAGEMGSNGTVDERLAEAEAARLVLGAAWRENLHWPDRRIGKDPSHLDQAVAFIRAHQPRVVAAPYWTDRHPDHVAASAVLTEAVFTSALRRYRPAEDAWKP